MLPHDPKRAVQDSKTDYEEHSGYGRNEKRPSRASVDQHCDGETGNKYMCGSLSPSECSLDSDPCVCPLTAT